MTLCRAAIFVATLICWLTSIAENPFSPEEIEELKRMRVIESVNQTVVSSIESKELTDSAFYLTLEGIKGNIAFLEENTELLLPESGYVDDRAMVIYRALPKNIAQVIDYLGDSRFRDAEGLITSTFESVYSDESHYGEIVRGQDNHGLVVKMGLFALRTLSFYCNLYLSLEYNQKAVDSGDPVMSLLAYLYYFRSAADGNNLCDLAFGELEHLLPLLGNSELAQRKIIALYNFLDEDAFRMYYNIIYDINYSLPSTAEDDYYYSYIDVICARNWERLLECYDGPVKQSYDMGYATVYLSYILQDSIFRRINNSLLDSVALYKYITLHMPDALRYTKSQIYETSLALIIQLYGEKALLLTQEKYADELLDHYELIKYWHIQYIYTLKRKYDIVYGRRMPKNTGLRMPLLDDDSGLKDFPILASEEFDSYRNMDDATMRDYILISTLNYLNSIYAFFTNKEKEDQEILNDQKYLQFKRCSLLRAAEIIIDLYFDEGGLRPFIEENSIEHLNAEGVLSLTRIIADKFNDNFSSVFDYYMLIRCYQYGSCKEALMYYDKVKDYCNAIGFTNATDIAMECCSILGDDERYAECFREYSFKIHNTLYKDASLSSSETLDYYWTSFDADNRFYGRKLLEMPDYQNTTKIIYDNILALKGFLTTYRNNIDIVANASGDRELIDSREQLNDAANIRALDKWEEVEAYRLTQAKLLRAVEDAYGVRFMDYINCDALKDSLRDGECAIEFFVTYNKGYNGEVYALVLKKEYECPHAVRIAAEKQFIGQNERDLRMLYDTYWAPLAYELNGVERVFFSLDKHIDSTPLEYALDGEGRPFYETHKCHRLSSTKEIFYRIRTTAPIDNVVLYGGLDFKNADNSKVNVRGRSGSREVRSEYEYLSGSLEEVDSISTMMQRKGIRYEKYTGDQGVELTFSLIDGKPVSILHLATHGITLNPDIIQKNYNTLKGVELFEVINNYNDGLKGELWQNGLAMSGCNRTLMGLYGESIGLDDGILTAAEISQYDLSKVDLVVLSSCHSGYHGGADGYGLQRGFKLAGAKSMIMTLGNVDDDATQAFMVEFYRHYLSGSTKRESFQAALDLLRADDEFSDPYYWAPFILVDDLGE